MSDELEVQTPEPPSMEWLLTFADLVSLLITFFVLLYAMKEVNPSAWDELRGALKGVFTLEQPLQQIRPDQAGSAERITIAPADNLVYLENVLINRFKGDKALGLVTINQNPLADNMTISLPSHMLFESGNATLRQDGYDALVNLSDTLRNLDNKIEVAGHTDPSPITGGNYATNWELAISRAIEVANLLQRSGFDKPIQAVSYGSSRFSQLDENLAEYERYNRARRVDIVVYGNKG